MLSRLAVFLLSLLPVSAGIITDGAWVVYHFNGYFNTQGQTITYIVETDPLSSNVASEDFIINPAFQSSIHIPFTINFAEAPIKALKIFRSISDPEYSIPQVLGQSIQAEPIQAACGAVPCDFKAAEFRSESGGPWVTLGGNIDLKKKSVNVDVLVEAPIPFHILDPGFNAKTTYSISGPVQYDFTVRALTLWDIDVPEARSSALTGLGLLALAGMLQRNLRRKLRPKLL